MMAGRLRWPAPDRLLVVAGGALSIAHVVARSVLTAGTDVATAAQAGPWVPVNLLGCLGAGLVLLGLPALRGMREAGRPGAIGLQLIEVAWAFHGVFLSLYGALVLPWLAAEAPHLVSGSSAAPTGFLVAFAAGLTAWLAGTILLAVPLLRRRQDRGIGALLLGSAIWMLLGSLVIAPDGPAANLAFNLLSNLGPVLLLVALGALAWRESPAPSRAGHRDQPFQPRATRQSQNA